jgi:ATP-dependent helicase HrpB
VVLDEFHERHLDGDVSLALLRRLQQRQRPELRLVVMSATLDGDSVADYLRCRVIRSEGRLFPVQISYRPHSSAPLEEQVQSVLAETASNGTQGDVLIFLPGSVEIRRAMRSAEPFANRMLLLPLYGDLSPEEQDRAVLPAAQRKAIFSTNVAESSLTIDGVTVVIDSGLVRTARDNPFSGLPTLEVTRISKASANQRAGRAGRTAAGRVIRLYPQEDFNRRPDAEAPEIARRELSSLLLSLHVMGITPAEVPWFEAPPAHAITAADELLQRLNAYTNAKDLARLPLHPRLATMLLVCPGVDTCQLAAALSTGDRAPSPDIFSLLESTPSYQARRLADSLRRQLRLRPHTDDDLKRALVRAFPDRIVRAHTVSIPPHALTLKDKPLLLAVDLEQRRESALPLVRLATPVDPELLVDVFPESITEDSTVEWNRAAERVEARSVLLYGNIVIEESRSGSVDPEAAAHLLAEKAIEAGLTRFADPDELDRLLARCAFAARHSNLPEPDPLATIEQLSLGLKSFAELEQADLLGALLSRYTPQQRQLLDQIAPDRLRLPSGRTAKINYAMAKDPWIASRLQDFFGWRDTPRIANNAVPLTLHLLAPNQRPVQTTRDLSGFWQRLYPQLRRELGRRYPKHKWPEDPLKPAEL